MTATNHILAGAVIGLYLKEPIIAVPLAFGSHFVLDWLPHFGMHTWQERQKHKKLFNFSIFFDVVAALFLVSFLLISSAEWLVLTCALFAYLPDAAWIYIFVFIERMGTRVSRSSNRFNRFHTDIQKRESIKFGGLLELIFLITGSAIVTSQLL